MQTPEVVQRAAEAIAAADAILIGAGAGMGVDSGMPDFRGSQGFWRAYPPYQKMGLDFASLANPMWFTRDPQFAWGFYGHRLHLYRDTAPHDGFAVLRRFAARVRGGAFVFTSNVDGHFQRAGFPAERVYEIHGSIHHMQCTRGCAAGILSADEYSVSVDVATMRAAPPLPSCPRCRGLLRPNILMFGDSDWDSQRSDGQSDALERWLEEQRQSSARMCVIECGAGRAIPSVRNFCTSVARGRNAALIRINVREAEPDSSGYTHLALPMGALAGLRAIEAALPAAAR